MGLWPIQYLVAAVIALVVSVSIFRKNMRSYAYISFLAYGIDISAWMILIYLHRTATTVESTSMYFDIMTTFFTSVFPLLLITLMNIIKERVLNLVALAPGIATLIVYRIASTPEFVYTEYGWSYFLKFKDQYSSIAAWTLYFVSLIAFVAILIFMITRSHVPRRYRRNYIIMFLSCFGLQGVGVIGSNLLLQAMPGLPPIAGFLNLGSFLLTTYTLRISQITVLPDQAVTNVEEANRSYAFFLENFFAQLSGSELGQDAFQFHDFLARTTMTQFVSETENGYSIRTDSLAKTDQIGILDRTLEVLEDHPEGMQMAQYLAYPLVVVQRQMTENGREKDFQEMVIGRHLGFLLSSDLSYSLASRSIREPVNNDTSLAAFTDWEMALKLYKRIIARMLTPSLFSDFKEELTRRTSMYNLTRYLRFDPIGNPICDIHGIESITSGDRLSAIVESYNPFVAWLVEHLYTQSEQTGQDASVRLRETLMMNQNAALRLRIYPSLLSSLMLRLSPQRLAYIYLTNGSKSGEINTFSRRFNLSHDQLVGKVVLLEFDPRVRIQELVEDLAVETKTNGERLVVFTRRRSDVDMSLLDAEKYYLVSSARKSVAAEEKTVPVNDTTSLLGVLISISSDPFACVFFDNLTDLCINLGQEATYSALRHMTDALGETRAPFILLLNPRAHSAEVVSAFETLSNVILMQDNENLRVVKS